MDIGVSIQSSDGSSVSISTQLSEAERAVVMTSLLALVTTAVENELSGLGDDDEDEEGISAGGNCLKEAFPGAWGGVTFTKLI